MFHLSRVCLLLALVLIVPGVGAEQLSGWRADWELPAGVGVDIDTQGYHYPTALAFVPEPGDGPKDPLYFVTELRGAVKVVTNDRTVYTFADDFFRIVPKAELPDVRGQIGMAGICLDPQHGYVFVTFAYSEQKGVYYNAIVRFETEPEHFGLKPRGKKTFSGIFRSYPTSVAHQIGNCQIADGVLYVGVGDGFQADKALVLDNLYGKILRMSLEGEPLPDNPFFDAARPGTAQNFVWSYGWRNPFSLSVVGGELFAADNGYRVDRFLKVEKGGNYLWDGSDRSIAANADFVLTPNPAPAQMTFFSGEPAVLPERYAGSFMLAASVNDPATDRHAGVFHIPYDLAASRVSATPGYLVRYVGERHQRVVGMAVGPGGLYFTALHPVENGGAVLRLSRAEGAGAGHLAQLDNARMLMLERGCLGCHNLGRHEAQASVSQGPSLDGPLLLDRLETRLLSPQYLQQVAEIDRLDEEPFVSFRMARREVLAAQGVDRVRLWIKYHIMEPRFDTRTSAMPNLGVPEHEAELITDFLLQDVAHDTWWSRFRGRLKTRFHALLPAKLQPVHIRWALVLGFVVGVVSVLMLILLRARFRGGRH